MARVLGALRPPEPALAHLRSHFGSHAREVHDKAQYNLLLLNPRHADSLLHFTCEPAASSGTDAATERISATLTAFAVRREPATGRAPAEAERLEMCELQFVQEVVAVLGHYMWCQALS